MTTPLKSCGVRQKALLSTCRAADVVQKSDPEENVTETLCYHHKTNRKRSAGSYCPNCPTGYLYAMKHSEGPGLVPL